MLPLWGVYCFEGILIPARWAGLRYIGPLGRNSWTRVLFPKMLTNCVRLVTLSPDYTIVEKGVL